MSSLLFGFRLSNLYLQWIFLNERILELRLQVCQRTVVNSVITEDIQKLYQLMRIEYAWIVGHFDWLKLAKFFSKFPKSQKLWNFCNFSTFVYTWVALLDLIEKSRQIITVNAINSQLRNFSLNDNNAKVEYLAHC